ncbi:hypothetical protein KEM54_005083 [Ascosphaera aggregata]|nr:hypothetical protein KEM54_005083 [Ascosphaera aggregata]
MDFAYDHIQEEILASSDSNPEGNTPRDTLNNTTDKDDKQEESSHEPTTASAGRVGGNDLSTEFQETFRALQQNPWGQKLGGIWDHVRQKGESVYKEATKEYSTASGEAAKGLSGWKESIVKQTRGLSLGGSTSSSDEKRKQNEEVTRQSTEITSETEAKEDPKAADGTTLLTKFKDEAAKRLKDIQKAEDAADEALARWGSTVAGFFKDAISVTGPDGSDASGNVLFESRDGSGKRVIHTSRLEAQLHVIHANPDRMMNDPESQAWPQWQKDFKVEEKTDVIAKDLEAYPELRKAMEALVPEKVQYQDFWRRYYFLRHIVETEEQRRKDILKGAASEEEEVDWDNDSDDEGATPIGSPQHASASRGEDEDNILRRSRPSNEQSLPDSDASYDIVSGTATTTPRTPKGADAPAAPSAAKPQKAAEKEEESSDDDWE